MEISKLRGSSPIKTSERRIHKQKDFSKNFSFAQHKKSEEELKKMLKGIKSRGLRLCATKCFSDVKAYKREIKLYLESVLAFMYEVKRDTSFWQTQYYITVETIDKKLEELTQMLLSEEKESLDIASTIDDITGLIVDVYK